VKTRDTTGRGPPMCGAGAGPWNTYCRQCAARETSGAAGLARARAARHSMPPQLDIKQIRAAARQGRAAMGKATDTTRARLAAGRGQGQ